MRGVHAVVQIQVTAYMHIWGCLPLEQHEETFYSSYNPPIRYIYWEPKAGVVPPTPVSASLLSFTPHSESLATFRFKTDTAITYEPGQHTILDMSSMLQPTGYKHMATYRGGEKELNDDGVRTWTISSAASSTPSDTFDITMRRCDTGSITPILFAFGGAVLERNQGRFEGGAEFSVPLLGIGGDFTMAISVAKRAYLTFIAGGIGITPFLSMLAALSERQGEADVDMVVAVKDGELEIVQRMIEDAVKGGDTSGSLSIVVHLLSSHHPPTSQPLLSAFIRHHNARLGPDTLRELGLRHAVQGSVYLCGSPSFEQAARGALAEIGVEGGEIKNESFLY
jgi:ferredoxin-NADP reductase